MARGTPLQLTWQQDRRSNLSVRHDGACLLLWCGTLTEFRFPLRRCAAPKKSTRLPRGEKGIRRASRFQRYKFRPTRCPIRWILRRCRGPVRPPNRAEDRRPVASASPRPQRTQTAGRTRVVGQGPQESNIRLLTYRIIDHLFRKSTGADISFVRRIVDGSTIVSGASDGTSGDLHSSGYRWSIGQKPPDLFAN